MLNESVFVNSIFHLEKQENLYAKRTHYRKQEDKMQIQEKNPNSWTIPTVFAIVFVAEPWRSTKQDKMRAPALIRI